MKHIQEFLNTKGFTLTTDGIIGQMTMNAIDSYIKKELQARKWVLSPKDIIWVRTDAKLTNTFDDFGALYIKGALTQVFPCSTTAGRHYVINPITTGGITGTAITCPQQVLQSHQFHTDLFIGKPYFRQVKPIVIWRDGDKDGEIDTSIISKGIFGIHFHRGGKGNSVDNWSAGCQVVPDEHWEKVYPHFTNSELMNYTLIG